MDDLPDKSEKPQKKAKPKSKQASANSDSGVSRRDFLKISGVSAAVPLISKAGAFALAEGEVPVHGPGKVPVTLNVNGKKLAAQLEPRVTLLDALRDQFELTGAKRVCDRGTCGACTVLLDGKAVYSCSLLAIDAQGRQITTVEGLAPEGSLHPIQQAFVDNDVVATKAFLDQHPNPSAEQINHGLGGNFCRCGTYAGIRAAIAQVASNAKTGKGA